MCDVGINMRFVIKAYIQQQTENHFQIVCIFLNIYRYSLLQYNWVTLYSSNTPELSTSLQLIQL